MNTFYGWRLVAAVWVILLINAALPSIRRHAADEHRAHLCTRHSSGCRL